LIKFPANSNSAWLNDHLNKNNYYCIVGGWTAFGDTIEDGASRYEIRTYTKEVEGNDKLPHNWWVRVNFTYEDRPNTVSLPVVQVVCFHEDLY
jgi:hypothetical protein